jgi:hypothetical protein
MRCDWRTGALMAAIAATAALVLPPDLKAG